ncbi:ZIP family metal transporter [Candidatus Uhrbacteria bacterium]|nr:ZIP family metal transporter [Candidatus Uhrbacteria bacterium]
MPLLLSILIATGFIALLSVSGAVLLFLKQRHLSPLVLTLVALSAGAMLGNVAFHLLPEVFEAAEAGAVSLFLAMLLFVGSFVLSFFFELFFSAYHCHSTSHAGEEGDVVVCHHRVKPFARLVLYSDAIHNFIDGLLIAAAFAVSLPLGITTALAVALHEIPQELGDFAVLLHGGYKKSRALAYNAASALTVVAGGLVGFFVTASTALAVPVLIPLAAGSFFYIAAADLMPELKHEEKIGQTVLHASVFVLGLAFMALTALLE